MTSEKYHFEISFCFHSSHSSFAFEVTIPDRAYLWYITGENFGFYNIITKTFSVGKKKLQRFGKIKFKKGIMLKKKSMDFFHVEKKI